METYCVSCKKNTENENSSVRKTKHYYQIALFVARKNQLSLKIKNSKILVIFQMISLKWIKSLTNLYRLEKDLLPELHLKQPGFAYSACGRFTKNRGRIQKCRQSGNLKHLYRNELDKACFANDTAYSDNKDVVEIIMSDKILKDRTYKIATSYECDRCQRALASMVYKFFDKKKRLGASVNEELAEELHKPVIKNFKRRKVYARFKDSIRAADLAEMESLSSMNKNVNNEQGYQIRKLKW